MHRDDQEFLPAALEILERPASPIGIGLLLFICALATAALAWSWFGWTDVVAVAQGKVQPSGRVKTVQFVEGGRVARILVENGAMVKQDDPLVELDSADAAEDVRALTAAFHSLSAEVLRRMRNVEASAAEDFTDAAIAWPENIPGDVRRREEELQRGELRSFAAELRTIDGQRQQKIAERERLTGTIRALRDLIALLDERVQMRTTLEKNQVASRAVVIDAAEVLSQQLVTLAREQGQLAEVARALELLELERDRIKETFAAENLTKASEARRQIEDVAPRLAKAELRLERMTLRSPVDGIVHASSVTSIGQVFSPGQEVMRIVPSGSRLEMEVYLPNRDIGFVEPGQIAAIKVEAYPYTRYGTIAAKVSRIAHDAIPEPDARMSEADPTRLGPSLQAAGAQRVQSLVFPVTLVAERDSLIVDGKTVPLVPGMAVSAEIKTGKRRILEYLLSPIREVTSESIRER
ncbi:HlyD family type I secretion periplasmic adaptor subunit [Aestuariivirga sp.]|uniref:HlyD family type I secretion periplasmic adaptor subunit n=1 Tax=Aestuariivirga sp. TaxID=2650926 RepID=UPI0039193EC4